MTEDNIVKDWLGRKELPNITGIIREKIIDIKDEILTESELKKRVDIFGED